MLKENQTARLRCMYKIMTHSFIHSGHFYSASSSPELLRSALNTARILLCRSFTPKRHRQLRVKNLPKVLMWRLGRDLIPRTFIEKTSNLPMRHYAPHNVCANACMTVVVFIFVLLGK